MENKNLPIKKVLVIGSGPIVIGQAAEFDYAGTQACRALREEGVTTVLANSNPATIMTDEDIADVVYSRLHQASLKNMGFVYLERRWMLLKTLRTETCFANFLSTLTNPFHLALPLILLKMPRNVSMI